MKAVVRLLASFAMVCFVAAAASAQGVLISSKVTTGTAAPTTQEMQIDKNRMRVEMNDPASGGKTVMIFDGAKQVMQIVTVERKTYMEITKATVEQLAAQMQGMMAQMEAAMASMPPAQRAQMEAMMRGRGGAGMAAAMAPPKPEYRKTGTDRVGKWACDKYEGMANGQKVSDLCTVEPSALGLAAADMAVVTQIADFAKSLTSMIPGAASGLAGVGITGQGFPGLPIRTITTVGASTTTSEITDVSRQTFPDSLFQVPAGFTKQDMPMMGGRGRQ